MVDFFRENDVRHIFEFLGMSGKHICVAGADSVEALAKVFLYLYLFLLCEEMSFHEFFFNIFKNNYS